MLRHALREDVPPNAAPGAALPELLAGVSSSREGMETLRKAIEAAKAGKRWQKSVKPVLDVLVTFSHQDGERLSEADQNDYFKRALAFVQERFGGAENVLAAAVHRDESTAHVQILMLAREPGGVKLGASQFMGNRGNLHRLQNDFWQACGKPFGLQRGEPRTGARNLPVRQLYGALAAGAEVPELVPVPVVSFKDRMLAPEKQAQRDRAIEHNQSVIEQLRAQAGRGAGLHPQLIEQQAERYRKALARADKAEKEAQESTLKAQKAAEELRGKQREIDAMEGYLQKLDKQLMDKNKEVDRIDNDIDRLRNLRDEERKEFGSGLDCG